LAGFILSYSIQETLRLALALGALALVHRFLLMLEILTTSGNYSNQFPYVVVGHYIDRVGVYIPAFCVGSHFLYWAVSMIENYNVNCMKYIQMFAMN